MLKNDPIYLFKLPKEIPADVVLVHNSVRPTRRLGARGFRAWLEPPDEEGLEICDCAWAPELGLHFRVKAALGRHVDALAGLVALYAQSKDPVYRDQLAHRMVARVAVMLTGGR